ncbi:uncharacterized protein LOC110029446 [Phalaenopsis equestris]|uniref:uncharacterized protein LOC110029446 n=1 Tax=Phalaenopsis equestris TaxID=78828 RepID=UPI0009E1FEAA|nr:uncharacterized protein LOC110029446 [Phalaenopsis equestris]
MNMKGSNIKRGLLETSALRRKDGVSSSGLQKRMETPSTPGRPVFKFSVGNFSRKSVPSKWEDAEKWLMSGSCHESPAHGSKPSEMTKLARQNVALQRKAGAFDQEFGEKLRISEGIVSNVPVSSVDGPGVGLILNEDFHGFSSEILLKDTFTDIKQPVLLNFRYPDPSTEEFFFKDSYCETVENSAPEAIAEVHRRDVGTEMTPLGSSKSSRCHTPMKSSSPARHNTPADRSGPLVISNSRINISDLKDCHFAKLKLSAQYGSVVSYWGSREEEEEEVSKSLRYSEVSDGRKSIAEHRACLWEEDERTKSCIRYQREEAKIQAWVNLQTAKAEAQSRKLEVKIQKMRSNLEEKLMKKMAIVHRRAQEWRASAQLHHSQQIFRTTDHAQKMKTHQSFHFSNNRASCGCFSMQQ